MRQVSTFDRCEQLDISGVTTAENHGKELHHALRGGRLKLVGGMDTASEPPRRATFASTESKDVWSASFSSSHFCY